MKQTCELCGGEAVVFCEADAAFLCWSCDASVHGANFLVARHLRRVACARCDALCPANHVLDRARRLCDSCSPDQDRSDVSSSVLSTSESAATAVSPRRSAATAAPPRRSAVAVAKRLPGEAEAVLLSWSRRMGLRNVRRCSGAAARMAAECSRTNAVLPLRVALAAALWSSIKRFEIETSEAKSRAGAEALRRLEACSGVPARLIMAAEWRIGRRVRVADAEEGWAECA